MKANELKIMAKNFGADLIGIAPVERFAHLPKEKNPLSIFPECKSVIVIGKRVLRGSIRGIEEGTNFETTYRTFGHYHLQETILTRISYQLTCWIEDHGFDAVPLFGHKESSLPLADPVSPDKPAPNVTVEWEYAAHAAGLAEYGLGGFMITPEYGIRQRFAMILTDCELEADTIKNSSLCKDCSECANACPFGAINTDKKIKKGVPGYEREVAEVDTSICEKCPNGALLSVEIPRYEYYNFVDRIASACGRACMVYLEDKIQQKFTNKFRKRTPWVRDLFGRNVCTAEENK